MTELKAAQREQEGNSLPAPGEGEARLLDKSGDQALHSLDKAKRLSPDDTTAFHEALARRKQRRRRRGLAFILLGIFLFAGSLLFYRHWQQLEARMRADASRILADLRSQDTELPQESQEQETGAPALRPVRRGDYNYLGVLRCPDLELELPVLEGWSQEQLDLAPCTYSGSPYDPHFVLCAHNSLAHFGRLPELSPGSDLIFTDFSGHTWHYRLVESQIYPDTAIAEIKSSDWDLTLFTCTYAGISRFAARYDLVEPDPLP